MRLLIMDGDTVANVIEVDATAIPPEFADAPVAPEGVGVGVGMVWDGAGYVDPTPDPSEQLAAERARMVASRFQAKAAMSDAGLLSDAENAVAAADARTQLAWAEAVEFQRKSPAINALASQIGLTDEQIDDLFRSAMEIEA